MVGVRGLAAPGCDCVAPRPQLRLALLALVPKLGQAELAALLAQTFEYLPVPELRAVPVGVLGALQGSSFPSDAV